MNKKFYIFALICIMMLPSTALAQEITADENADLTIERGTGIFPRANINVDITYNIKKYGTAYTENTGKSTEFYNGKNYPCTQAGETVTPSASVAYSNSITGTISSNGKTIVQAALGYTFGKTETYGISKTSRGLKVGEYVVASHQKMYRVTPITEEKVVHTYGYQTVNGYTKPVNSFARSTTESHAKKALLPDIKLEYKKSTSKGRSLNGEDITTAVENYSFIDGEYVLVGSEDFTN